MKGLTKKQCITYENMAIQLISSVLGKPDETLSAKKWVMPHDTGAVSITLFCDSEKSGHCHRSPWLACRLDDDKYIDPDRYVTAEGFPYPFSNRNGKCNLHPDNSQNIDQARTELLMHLCGISDGVYGPKFNQLLESD